MKNLIKLASQTIDGLRALPAMGRLMQHLVNERSIRGELDEAKARIATLVESDGKLRRENERLSTELNVSRSATADWRREHTHLKTQFDTVATEYARADGALQSANLEITRLKSDLEFWIRAKSDR